MWITDAYGRYFNLANAIKVEVIENYRKEVEVTFTNHSYRFEDTETINKILKSIRDC